MRKLIFLGFILAYFICALNLQNSSAAPQNVNSDANINNNGKNDGLKFKADVTLTVGNNDSVNSNANVDGVVTTVGDGTGTVTFNGNSATNGNFGASGGGLKQINADGGAAKTVSFNGNIFASILNFGGNGTVTLADTNDLTGTVATSTDNKGKLTFLGSSNVSGDVGASGMILNQINADGAGNTVAFGGDVFANTLNFGADGTVSIADSKNLTAEITTSSGGTGTLTFLGDSTVSGKVGASGTSLLQVNANGIGKNVNFNNNVFANTLNFGADGTVTMANNRDIEAVVTTSTDNTGTLTFSGGNSTVTGDLGALGAALKKINADGTKLTLKGNAVATNLNFGADGTVTMGLNKDFTGAITTSADNTGTLTFNGKSDITGNVGTAAAALKKISIDGANKVVRFVGDVFAKALDFSADNTVRIADGYNLNSPVTTSATNTGTLTFQGATTTGGDMGTLSGNLLAEVNFNGATSLGHNIAATTTTVKSGSTVTLSKDITAEGDFTLASAADSILDLGENTLTLAGTGVYSQKNTSQLKLGVSGTNSGSIVASGNASVKAGSVLDISVNSYVPNNTSFKIIDGAGG
ncbi:MAG: hypothetical protein KJ818_01710, partial [Candidatus Omnitrophica bacterium]|nr:hypothetical protein [Candidatus Omnitrophota bacterium]